MHRGRGGRMKLLLGGARRAISPCSTEQIHSKSVLLELAIQHLGPPTETHEVVVSQCATTLQIVIDDPDPWDDVSALLGP